MRLTSLGFGRQQGGCAGLFGDLAGYQCGAFLQQQALHRCFAAGQEDERALSAVTIGRIVLATQAHILAGDDRRQISGSVCFRGIGGNRLDAGELDLAAVGEAEAAAMTLVT